MKTLLRNKTTLSKGCFALVGVALALHSSEAEALDFDAQGNLLFDASATTTESFETIAAGDFFTIKEDSPLHGAKYIRATADAQSGEYAQIALTLPQENKAYKIRAFLRGVHEWTVSLIVRYNSGEGPAGSYIPLSFTARSTSDGWYEVSSGTFSFDGTRDATATLLIAGTSVDIDALEIVPVEGAYKQAKACTSKGAGQCDTGDFCFEGYCHEGDASYPPLPDAEARINMVNYLAQQMNIFFGGVYTRANNLPMALVRLEQAKNATTAGEFWSLWGWALRELRDGHTFTAAAPSYYARKSSRALPVCFVEGDADLSQGQAPSDAEYKDILISHVGPDATLGLKAGDRLVAIDGVHPIAWYRSMVDVIWTTSLYNDPRSQAQLVERLPSAIKGWASVMTVIRCDEATQTCGQPEDIAIGSLPPDDGTVLHPNCDHRPQYHLAMGNPDPVTHNIGEEVYHGLAAESQPGEDIYGMIWNYTIWSGQGQSPWEEAYSEFRANAKGVILDHRTGNGGTPQGAAYLTTLSCEPRAASVWGTISTLGMYDAPFDQTDGLAMWSALGGTYSQWDVGSVDKLSDDKRIALLLARDISGSDFFPWAVKGAPNTRLFGRSTAGAYSTFVTFSYPGVIWSLASGDFIAPDGTPQIGKGVDPDEEIVPKQSDLMMGKDTVYERALEWVRTGM